jgi:hypothetical protein
MAPIVHLTISPPGGLVEIAATPALAQIRSLSTVAGPWLDDDGVVALANSPYVANLRCLELVGGQITGRGLNALASSPNLKSIVYVNLTGNPGCEERPVGMQAEIVGGEYYLVGVAGLESLREAHTRANRGYDPEDVLWPPPDERLAYEA